MRVKSDFQVHGILANYWAGEESPLPTFHRHNEVELNLLTRGSMTYTIAGHSAAIPLDTLCVFWGGFSHQILDWEPYGEIWSVAVPLTSFLRWPLPHETFVYPLMHGMLLMETDASQASFDRELIRRWFRDLHDNPGQPALQEIVLLETQARIRRLAGTVGAGHVNPQTQIGEAERVARMLQFIAVNYSKPIMVADIAKASDTNASYAMELFKQSCGVSIMQYVNDQRVAHARRMLATTDAKILDIAFDAGFGSLSQFHNVFRKVTGQTPREYTHSINGASGE